MERTINEHISKTYNMFRVMEEKKAVKGRALDFRQVSQGRHIGQEKGKQKVGKVGVKEQPRR